MRSLYLMFKPFVINYIVTETFCCRNDTMRLNLILALVKVEKYVEDIKTGTIWYHTSSVTLKLIYFSLILLGYKSNDQKKLSAAKKTERKVTEHISFSQHVISAIYFLHYKHFTSFFSRRG